MSEIEEIKSLYHQVEHKTRFIASAAKEFEKSPQAMKNHWLCDSGFWSVPKKHQAKLIKLLKRQIQIQNGIEL